MACHAPVIVPGKIRWYRENGVGAALRWFKSISYYVSRREPRALGNTVLFSTVTGLCATMEKCSGLPAKQRKLDSSPRGAKSAPKASRLDNVPVEILAEILHHVTSPKDVLSVARCNKRLRATLLNPSNVMIWRRARSNCVVPNLPPPPLNWSESTYAAFIFDSGICHVCRAHSCPFFIHILY
jgi:hypothetical protein